MRKPIPLYTRLGIAGAWLAPIVLLLLRLVLGWDLVITGRGHLQHLDSFTNFFTNLGIPYPHISAIITATTELVCGGLITAGLLTRLAAIPLLINFIVAYATDGRETYKPILSSDLDPTAFIQYAAFPFLVLCLIMMSFGPGIFSLDSFLYHAVFHAHESDEPTRPPVA